MPPDRSRYPDDWAQLAQAVKVRANWRCECLGECRIEHAHGRCHLEQGQVIAAMKGVQPVRLTVVFLDHRPENTAPANLRAMCPPCQSRYEAAHTPRESKARRRRAALEFAGQMTLDLEAA